MKKLINLFIFICVMGASADAQLYRLSGLAVERWESNLYKPKDSVTYFYSLNRTGIPGWQWVDVLARSEKLRDSLYELQPQLQYDSAWAWRGGTSGYSKVLTYKQTMNSYDLITTRGRYSSGTLTASDEYNYAGQFLNEKIVAGIKYSYHFNSNNLPDTIRLSKIKVSNGPWVEIGLIAHVYDVNNKVTSIYRDIEGAQTTWLHDYNGNNQLSQTTVITGGTLLSDTIDQHLFAYTTGNDLETEYHKRRNTGGNLEEYDLHNNYYDLNHNKLQDFYMVWNNTKPGWDSVSRGTYTYNNQKLVTAFEMLHWDATNKTFIPMEDASELRTSLRIRFNYGFAWPLSVSEIISNNELNIYPVPASNVLSIHASFATAQNLTVSITDMQGRAIRTWSEPSTKDYRRTIPVADLPAGNYVLKLNEMVKQFVVR